MRKGCTSNATMNSHLFLGMDLSTQQLKAIVIDDQCHVVNSVAVNFASELPEFKTENGVHRHSDGRTVTSPVHMWLKAIDMCFTKLTKNVDVARIRAISGCGQQHGTVYWNGNAEKCLSNLCKSNNLVDALKDAFAKNDSPIWMDSSTTEECEHMERAVGGPMALANITGSRAFHRFSGNQILKIIRKEKPVYDLTERISLVSSFVPSILCGHIVDIDEGDAGGMNLMDVKKGVWSEQCLAVLASTHEEAEILMKKLGSICSSQAVLGTISSYFCERYGFSPKCEIVAFTGDNLSSLAGLCLQSGDVAVSLGTSDTLFLSLSHYRPALEGHIFKNPIDSSAFMGMLCFKNGSFTRNRIRKMVVASDWDAFAALVTRTPPGNNGNIGFYFDDNEIVPNVSRGDYRFNSRGEQVSHFEVETEARAVLEHQCLAKRLHAENIGYDISNRKRIFVTGGASGNRHIAQILADVFNCCVYARESTDSAALGGALRARHCSIYRESNFFNVSANATSSHLIAEPNSDAVKVYDRLLPIYAQLEKRITSQAL
uniref:Xylulose kinase n=1 Tax=Ascaris suum TaxID=6253 RepID=F1L1I1_ASCSU